MTSTPTSPRPPHHHEPRLRSSFAEGEVLQIGPDLEPGRLDGFDVAALGEGIVQFLLRQPAWPRNRPVCGIGARCPDSARMLAGLGVAFQSRRCDFSPFFPAGNRCRHLSLFGGSHVNSRHKNCSTERNPVSESLRTHARKDGHRAYENRNFGKICARQIKQSKSELGSDFRQPSPQRPVRAGGGCSAHGLSEVGSMCLPSPAWEKPWFYCFYTMLFVFGSQKKALIRS